MCKTCGLTHATMKGEHYEHYDYQTFLYLLVSSVRKIDGILCKETTFSIADIMSHTGYKMDSRVCSRYPVPATLRQEQAQQLVVGKPGLLH